MREFQRRGGALEGKRNTEIERSKSYKVFGALAQVDRLNDLVELELLWRSFREIFDVRGMQRLCKRPQR